MASLYKFRNTPIIKRLIPTIYKFWRRGKSNYRIAVRNNIEWLLYSSSIVDRNLIIWGVWEIEQQNKMVEFGKKNNADVFIDVGSCFGLYAITLKKKIPSLEVHAFEPHPINRQQLQTNILLNDEVGNITVHDDALGAVSEKKNISFFSNKNRGAAKLNNSSGSGFIVNVTPMDEILKYENKVILIRIDVEGFEKEVLRGMRKIIENNKCFMQIECLDAEGDQDLFPLLKNLGLNVVGHISVDYYVTNF